MSHVLVKVACAVLSAEAFFHSYIMTHHTLQENSDKYPAHNKLQGMLSCVEEELHDVPLYYTLTGLARTLKVDTLNFDKFRNAIVNAGYRMSGTHCNPNGLKTDAPPEVCVPTPVPPVCI